MGSIGKITGTLDLFTRDSTSKAKTVVTGKPENRSGIADPVKASLKVANFLPLDFSGRLDLKSMNSGERKDFFKMLSELLKD